MQLTQGQRTPLSSFVRGSAFTLTNDISTSQTIDYACFGVDAQGKLSDDRYMVFFNQPTTPCNSIELKHAGEFRIELASLPPTIDRLVFTAAIDGAGSLHAIGTGHFAIRENGHEVARCTFSGTNFADEKAVMLAELYRKNGEWRIAANLQGFNAGLAALVEHFGGAVMEAPPAPVANVSLEKKIAAAAPHLVSLAKKATVSLEKANLSQVKARVGLVLDVSGSMNAQYSRGRVQEVVNRMLPLAVHFDDNGALDCWAFGSSPVQLADIDLANHKDYILTEQGGWKRWAVGSRVNNEPAVMRQVIDFYKDSGERTPIYVLFISDGGVHENRAITRLMAEAAALPIFWQFVGLGGRDYGILAKLDDMAGRQVDNCNFFALDDLDDVSEERLYELLMEEFPGWLKAAKAAHIIA
ncbi:vWA domain-containing protein [Azomonas macrocytogenes]|uniref:Stress response protein SCP2 n=1 Tax=Azomonas macrocytogenes TaxID=69962 RepID=A0A839T3X2_AZOMA|nr:VWA domain-containing protein [Azomonas macrocytogenes]MBB3104231.1 stress response protein SCP2 [Azomonas macrocytogenes]